MISVALTNYHKSPFLNPKVNKLQNIARQLPSNSRVYFEGNLNGQTRYIELFLSDCIFAKRDEADYIISKDLKLEKNEFKSSPTQ